MKTWSKYFGFLIIALGLTASCFAEQAQIPGKYYFKPDEVYIAPNGIYASIDGILIQIHTLCSDRSGVFVSIEEIIAGNLEYCPFCQSWYDPEYGHDCDGPRD